MRKPLLYILLLLSCSVQGKAVQKTLLGFENLTRLSCYAPVRIHNAEGYVNQQNKYCYYRKDHLGNNRQVWNGTNNQVFQQMRYYPSGLPNYYYSSSTSLQPYMFNGKEFVEAHGLDVTDLGWRGVYNAINRFTTIDRFAEKTPWQSPYAHANNNPINYIDPDGRAVKPAGTAELTMIQNTLPKEARDYVRLDNNGFIDQALLNSYGGESLNFNNLKTMVNAEMTLEVKLDDQFTFAGQNGQLGVDKLSYSPFDPAYPEDRDLTGSTYGKNLTYLLHGAESFLRS